jgi:hypothetical protein
MTPTAFRITIAAAFAFWIGCVVAGLYLIGELA